MNITVIGCGRWGGCIAWYLNKTGHRVTLYGRANSVHMQKLIKERRNEYISFPESLSLSTEYSCIQSAEIIVVSVPSHTLRSLCKELKKLEIKNKIFVLCMKGIENDTCKRLSEVVSEEVDSSNRVAVWLGPGHVEEFYKGIQNCMVIDSADDETKRLLVDSFTGDIIRFYYGTDLIGNEIGAASKNVIGIAAGMLDGLEMTSLKGALMARGTKEIAGLIEKCGGNPKSAYGLCHLGDYQATVFSQYSHNRKFGESFVRGEKFDLLAEGYYTVPALIKMAQQTGTELPICSGVYNVLYNSTNPKKALNQLFERSLKDEF